MNKEMVYESVSQKEICNQKLNQLFNFIDSEICTNHYACKRIGCWFPTYQTYGETCNREKLTDLHNILIGLHQNFSNDSKPKFLDCGSGYGEIGFLASITGFESYNVEIQEDLHFKAQEYTQKLEDKNIISKNSVFCLNGSFYTPDIFRIARENYKKFISFLVKGSCASPLKEMAFDLELPLNSSLEAIEAKLESLQQETNIWKKLPLLYQDDYFNFQVVYSFPSDPFFESGFMDQMGQVLKPDSFLILNNDSSQVGKIVKDEFSQFKKFGFDVYKIQSPYLVLKKNSY